MKISERPKRRRPCIVYVDPNDPMPDWPPPIAPPIQRASERRDFGEHDPGGRIPWGLRDEPERYDRAIEFYQAKADGYRLLKEKYCDGSE